MNGEAMRAAAEHPPVWDAGAYVSPADVAAAAGASPDFDVVVEERRPRPAGHATVDVPDLVVRARRRT